VVCVTGKAALISAGPDDPTPTWSLRALPYNNLLVELSDELLVELFVVRCVFSLPV